MQVLVPYKILAGAVRCGPWIVSLASKPATHPCRLAAGGRVGEALLEAVLGVALGFVLVVVAGARRGAGGGRGGEPPSDGRPKDPDPRPVSAPV